jgi:hypothetical protein
MAASVPDEQRLDVAVKKVCGHILGYGGLHNGQEIQVTVSHLRSHLKAYMEKLAEAGVVVRRFGVVPEGGNKLLR